MNSSVIGALIGRRCGGFDVNVVLVLACVHGDVGYQHGVLRCRRISFVTPSFSPR